MDEEKVLCLSAYALASVKRTIVGCGGLSMFKSLRNDGTVQEFVGQALPKYVEQVCQEFDRKVAQMFVSMLCDKDKHFKWNGERHAGAIRALREGWLEARQKGIATTIDELPIEQ